MSSECSYPPPPSFPAPPLSHSSPAHPLTSQVAHSSMPIYHLESYNGRCESVEVEAWISLSTRGLASWYFLRSVSQPELMQQRLIAVSEMVLHTQAMYLVILFTTFYLSTFFITQEVIQIKAMFTDKLNFKKHRFLTLCPPVNRPRPYSEHADPDQGPAAGKYDSVWGRSIWKNFTDWLQNFTFYVSSYLFRVSTETNINGLLNEILIKFAESTIEMAESH